MKDYLSLVKFSHTIFALPFALLGVFLGFYQGGIYVSDWIVLLKVIACMVFARTAAMGFNRYVDRSIDKVNPRTSQREIPSGIVGKNQALMLVLMSSGLFVLTTYFINDICFYLSPVALLIILGYSYTKRFTAFCHLVLGLGLSLAPIGAYLAVTGRFDIIPILYSFSVLFWVAGFDIIYAMQDADFDRANQLYSMPVKLGGVRALLISSFLHVLSSLLILYAALLAGKLIPTLYWFHWLGAFIFIGLLIYQHTLVGPKNLARVNRAFFTTNGVASILFCGFFIIDLLI
ncbi:MAG: UbiA family prenyltransferase [Saprospiraceae bacterium]|nr:UbiA family prenyltransferase [Saprospiraceae bacterium]